MITASPGLECQAERRTWWAWILATACGIGLLKGGGTYAAAVTVMAWVALASVVSPAWLFSFTAVAAVCATILGVLSSATVARECGKKDPSAVVIDEVAGQLFALLAAPLHWKYLLASFILFRGFDIIKPPPLRQLERFPGGPGIMLDDVAAGFCALAVAQALRAAGLI